MEWTTQIAAAGAVLALLFTTLGWLRRRGMASVALKGSSKRQLQAVDRLRLSPQHTLHLVKLRDTVLLVASSPSGCTLLASQPSAGVGNGAGIVEVGEGEAAR